MKLKYYLRGLGVGILLTTLVLSAVLGKSKGKAELSDDEIIKRAEALGMEEKESGSKIDFDAIDESIGQTAKEEPVSSETEKVEPQPEAGKTDETKNEPEKNEDSSPTDKPQESGEDKNVGGVDQHEPEMPEEKEEPAKPVQPEAGKDNEKDSGDKKPDLPEKEDQEHSDDADQQNVTGQQQVTKTIIIKPGMSAKQVCILLEDQGVIASADAFNYYLLDHNLTERIKSKKLEIVVNSDFKSIASLLTD